MIILQRNVSVLSRPIVLLLVMTLWQSLARGDEFSDAASGDLAAVQLFVNENPDVELNEHRLNGLTMLHFAVLGGHTNVLSYLVGEGVDVDGLMSVHPANAAIHIAVNRGHSSVLSVLLEMGADLEQTNALGVTAMSLACFRNSTNEISMLLDYGAEPGPTDCGKFFLAGRMQQEPSHLQPPSDWLQIYSLFVGHGYDTNWWSSQFGPPQQAPGSTNVSLDALIGPAPQE